MKHQHKLNSQAREEELKQALLRETGAQTPLEFATAEEMLRHDALHTPVPPAIAQRLQESLGPLPAPRPSWWRRLLGQ